MFISSATVTKIRYEFCFNFVPAAARYPAVQRDDVGEMENRRKRRAAAADDLHATVKVSRRSETEGADEQTDATADADGSSRTGNSNGDAAVDRKQSPCGRCDQGADQPVRSRRRLATPSPGVNDEDVDVETEEDAQTVATTDERRRREFFCVDCRIQFTSPGTYRAHRSFYCSRRGRRDAAAGHDAPEPAARRRAPADQSRSWPDDLRSPDARPPALLPPSLALLEVLGAAGGAPPPPPPGAFFLAPFLAAAAAAAAAAGVPPASGAPAAVQTSPPGGGRPLPTPSRRSSTSVSDDEPLDLTTCRSTTLVVADSKRERASPSALAFPPRAFPDPLDAPSSLFLSAARLPPGLPSLPVVRQALSSPASVSHCADCNIVFYKHANYLAHKAHYCAGRHPTSDQPGAAGSAAKSLKSDADAGTALDDGLKSFRYYAVYSASDRGAEYCDERVCLSVCAFVRGHYLPNYASNLHQNFYTC